jgi:DNA polymerase (family 10)
MTNHEIADCFALLAKLMDIHGENSFKTKSYANAAFQIAHLSQEIANLSDAELAAIRGIGAAIRYQIRTLADTGKLPLLEEIIGNTPPGVLDMLQLKGIGPKKIAQLWKELGIETLGELEYACQENRLVTLKGFGAKTQAGILQSLAFLGKHKDFLLWAEAAALAAQVQKRLNMLYPEHLVETAGALRRQVEIVDRIDWVTDLSRQQLAQAFGQETVYDAASDGADNYRVQLPQFPLMYFHQTDRHSFYNALFRHSGSDAFLMAFKQQYTTPSEPLHEAAVFEANGLSWLPPALRESAEMLPLAAIGQVPRLIQLQDIKGIINCHSRWSDGADTIETLATAARDKGFEYLVISDHSQSAFYANGLKPAQVAAQHAEIDALNARLAPFKIFKGIESDILYDGSLDYTPEVLATFDLVIASVHSNLKMTREKATERVLKAVENPYTTILGHPTGRLLLSREGYPLDHQKVIDACAANRVVIEINAHPRRLDLDWRWIGYALEKGVLLSINPDAHALSGFDDVCYGIMTAQKGGLTATQNLSSFSKERVERFIGGRGLSA